MKRGKITQLAEKVGKHATESKRGENVTCGKRAKKQMQPAARKPANAGNIVTACAGRHAAHDKPENKQTNKQKTTTTTTTTKISATL